jgi:hypothetical protein
MFFGSSSLFSWLNASDIYQSSQFPRFITIGRPEIQVAWGESGTIKLWRPTDPPWIFWLLTGLGGHFSDQIHGTNKVNRNLRETQSLLEKCLETEAQQRIDNPGISCELLVSKLKLHWFLQSKIILYGRSHVLLALRKKLPDQDLR